MVVHGPGPQKWSMDPGPCFVYVQGVIPNDVTLSGFILRFQFGFLVVQLIAVAIGDYLITVCHFSYWIEINELQDTVAA